VSASIGPALAVVAPWDAAVEARVARGIDPGHVGGEAVVALAIDVRVGRHQDDVGGHLEGIGGGVGLEAVPLVVAAGAAREAESGQQQDLDRSSAHRGLRSEMRVVYPQRPSNPTTRRVTNGLSRSPFLG